MTASVVDASVVVKWHVPEVDADAARRLLEGEREFHVPDLLFPECGNVGWKKVQRGQIDATAARRIASAIAGFPFQVHAMQRLLPAAVEFAIRTGRTVYDSVYVVLAAELELALWTADDRLVNAAQVIGPPCDVRHIRDWTA
jgi:predicted nucleic acid-binding protein